MHELKGRRVLIVEDDYMIASDLAEILSGAGADPVGPVGWEQDALAVVADPSGPLDAAIMDVDLHGVPSYPIADELSARGVPIVFITGFSAHAIRPAYRHHVRLEKPVNERALLAALRHIV